MENIEAEVYLEKNETYYVKLIFLDFGMYVSGITVKVSPRFGGWWVQMPYYFDRARRPKKYIEFAKDSSLWPAIESKSIEALGRYGVDTTSAQQKQKSVTTALQDDPINLDDIQF